MNYIDVTSDINMEWSCDLYPVIHLIDLLYSAHAPDKAYHIEPFGSFGPIWDFPTFKDA